MACQGDDPLTYFRHDKHMTKTTNNKPGQYSLSGVYIADDYPNHITRIESRVLTAINGPRSILSGPKC